MAALPRIALDSERRPICRWIAQACQHGRSDTRRSGPRRELVEKSVKKVIQHARPEKGPDRCSLERALVGDCPESTKVHAVLVAQDEQPACVPRELPDHKQAIAGVLGSIAPVARPHSGHLLLARVDARYTRLSCHAHCLLFVLQTQVWVLPQRGKDATPFIEYANLYLISRRPELGAMPHRRGRAVLNNVPKQFTERVAERRFQRSADTLAEHLGEPICIPREHAGHRLSIGDRATTDCVHGRVPNGDASRIARRLPWPLAMSGAEALKEPHVRGAGVVRSSSRDATNCRIYRAYVAPKLADARGGQLHSEWPGVPH